MSGFAGLHEWHAASPPRLGIVFTDIVHSTGLLNAKQTDDYTPILRAHRARAMALAEPLDGLIEAAGKGDGLIGLFRSAADAYAFARALFEDAGHPALRIRAGVHVGMVRIVDVGGNSNRWEPSGRDVNFTHRVMAHGEPGRQLWVSDQAKIALEHEAGAADQLRWLASEECAFAGIPGIQRRWRAG